MSEVCRGSWWPAPEGAGGLLIMECGLTPLLAGVGSTAPLFDRGGASSRAVQSGVEATALHNE